MQLEVRKRKEDKCIEVEGSREDTPFSSRRLLSLETTHSYPKVLSFSSPATPQLIPVFDSLSLDPYSGCRNWRSGRVHHRILPEGTF